MQTRLVTTAVIVSSLSLGTLSAQAPVVLSTSPPLALGELQPPTELAQAIREDVIHKAGEYPFVGFRLFGRDSALLVFDDSTLTADALHANAWKFGPPVTTEEADGCPPKKVLGRKIARAFWRAWGRPAEVEYVMIAVRGTRQRDRWTVYTMYYLHNQLDDAWAGDPTSR